MAKYVKSSDQLIDVVDDKGIARKVTQRSFDVVYKGRGYRLASDVTESENDFSALSTDELQLKTNADLKAYLESKEIDYPSTAIKKELIELIAGK